VTSIDWLAHENTDQTLSPAFAPDHVVRDALVSRLHAEIEWPLTMVSAPAGYGKSTLICNSFGAPGASGAWLSLDESDSNIIVWKVGNRSLEE